jgi:hypothetical protein
MYFWGTISVNCLIWGYASNKNKRLRNPDLNQSALDYFTNKFWNSPGHCWVALYNIITIGQAIHIGNIKVKIRNSMEDIKNENTKTYRQVIRLWKRKELKLSNEIFLLGKLICQRLNWYDVMIYWLRKLILKWYSTGAANPGPAGHFWPA